MAGYPSTEREQRVQRADLERLVAAIFGRCGMSEADAALLADSLVTADLEGVHSHGVIRVPDYIHKLGAGGVDPRGQPRLVQESGPAIVIDGGNSMGQIGATFAMKRAIEAARTRHVVVAAVRGSNHCGALAYYTRMAARQGMIGIVATSALPTMAPWGGAEKILGMNPLSVAIPADQEPPIVFDAAFAASSHGKLRVYEQKGIPIPEGWAYDTEGRPTTDAAAAVAGLLQPIGGYKGVALALATGILSTLLSGASYGTELGDMVDGPRPGRDGHFMLVIDVSAFEDPAVFKRRVDGIVRQIHESRRAPGVERLWVPGEMETETARRYAEQGIPLNDLTLAGLRRAADELGVSSAPL